MRTQFRKSKEYQEIYNELDKVGLHQNANFVNRTDGMLCFEYLDPATDIWHDFFIITDDDFDPYHKLLELLMFDDIVFFKYEQYHNEQDGFIKKVSWKLESKPENN